MNTPTPRTDATCKALVAMLEPLRGGSRVTDAEMKALEGVITAFAKCATDLERDLAAREEELAQWTKWGVIEVMIRNPNIASFVKEKEAELAQANERADSYMEKFNAQCLVADEQTRQRMESDRELARYIREDEIKAGANKTLMECAELAREELARVKAERDAAVKLLREMVDSWDNGKEDDSIIASRRVTDSFVKAREHLAAIDAAIDAREGK